MQVDVNQPQGRFLQMPNKFRAFVAGFGSGKTWVGSMASCLHYLKHPQINQGYFAPTYPQIRDIFYPTIEEVAHTFGLRVKIKTGDKEVFFYNGRQELGVTLCRSMDNPASIIGFKIGRALCDELDTLPTDKARHAWRKIIARMRYKVDGVQNGIDVTTTPEGFRFVYQQFFDNPSEHYGIVQASTRDNAKNLPDDYIPSLIDSYPQELIDAYLDGQFVNLTSGTVYRNFDRNTCASTETIQQGDALLVGQDFNVNNMASVIYINRGGVYHAVAELSGGMDTPSVCDTLKQKYPNNKIILYPDASGQNRSSKGAAVSDISIIKAAGFAVRAKTQNPLVKDRVLSVNHAFSTGKLKINLQSCPELVKCIEQQAYDKNGEPDKSSGHDHMNDAMGYPIVYEMPINRPAIKPVTLRGMH